MEARKRYGGFEEVKPKEDQEFHQSRWERRAAELNQHMEAIGNPDGIVFTADELMHDEAKRDDRQYEKWLSSEHQESDQQLQEVVKDWCAVRDGLPDAPQEFRLVQLMLGAGVQSAQGTGQLLALEDMGLTKHTHAYIGSSGASGPILYAAEGRAGAACAVFVEDATTVEFLDKRGFIPKLDTGLIARVMRTKGAKGVSVDAIRKAKAKVIAIITNIETGKAELKDMKEMEDPIDACEASAAIPAFRKPVELDGKKYIDGAFADVPLEEIIKETNPTHLLIHPNKAFDFIEKFYSGLWKNIGLSGLTRAGSLSDTVYTAAQLGRMKERVGELLKKVGDVHNIKIAVLWPPDEQMDSLSNEPDTVRRGILESYRKTVSDFGGKQPEKVRFFANDNEQEVMLEKKAA